MGEIKWIFVLFAVLAAVSIMGIGVAISLASIWVALACVISLIVIMGLGFKTKKKYREEGRL